MRCPVTTSFYSTFYSTGVSTRCTSTTHRWQSALKHIRQQPCILLTTTCQSRVTTNALSLVELTLTCSHKHRYLIYTANRPWMRGLIESVT